MNALLSVKHQHPRSWWRDALLRLTGAATLTAERPSWIPIRKLSPRHRGKMMQHLLRLASQDRYLRFGYSATDEQIGRYVDGLNFARDEIYGVFNRRLELVAMAHLAFSIDPQWSTCAEFGVSVLRQSRGKGWGGRLFEHAVVHARNEGVHLLFIHALSENAAMLNIARHAGARVERDGSESEAYLLLPAATLDSRVNQIVNEKMSEVDYQLKTTAKQFRGLLQVLQEIRQGVRDARHHGSREPEDL
jgi:GNAT superfamily N-acetyltransferase